MPRLTDPQSEGELETFARKVAIVIAFAAGTVLLWQVRGVLLLVFVAAVIAAGIAPAVHRVRVTARFWLHRNISRGAAVLLVYFPFLFGVLLLAALVGPRLVVETRALGSQLPALIDANVVAPLERLMPGLDVRRTLESLELPRSSVVFYVRSAAAAVASVIAVLFMIVYMLIDAHRLRNVILLLYPASVRGERRRMLMRMARRMSSWLSAQLILSGIIGAAIFVSLILLRIPYALPLALVAMAGELVPVIGPIVGTAPALALAILHSRWQFWSLLAIVIVLQKIENLFIAPRVMARKVSISPLAAFIAFMIGGALLGIVGAMIAIPVAAIVQVGFDEAFITRRERRFDAERAGTLLRRVD